MRVTRQEKISYLVGWYEFELCKIDCVYERGDEVRVLNQIIIDSVGVSGLTKVKQIAWKRRGF